MCAGSRTGVVKLSCSILFIITRTLTSVPSFSVAATFTGTVVSVLDGDTLEVLNGHHAERIRLSGIDCPEKGQAFGQHAASSLVFGKQVTLQTHGLDKYGRTLADVLLPDGMNLNQEFLKQGWCWWYQKYAPGDTVLEGFEAEAREGRKGLWAEPPWEWRKRSR